MTHIRRAFKDRTVEVPVSDIVTTKKISRKLKDSHKYKSIISSVREVGIIEPLAVFAQGGDAGTKYLLLDGHLRLSALLALFIPIAPCLISTDDEGFTYNRQINRLSAIQEHHMILRALEKGVPSERIAATLEINVDQLKARQRLLNGIAPEVAEMLKNRMVNQAIFPILRKMKPIRQIEATEMMIASGRFSFAYARMILATTRPELLISTNPSRKSSGISPEDIARMEREMEKLNSDYSAIEDNHGETMLSLVIAKGYVNRLTSNPAIVEYLQKFHRELLDGLKNTLEDVAMDAKTLQIE